jgi:hypothetical protein
MIYFSVRKPVLGTAFLLAVHTSAAHTLAVRNLRRFDFADSIGMQKQMPRRCQPRATLKHSS